MNLRAPLLALLVASPLAMAEAQSCLGSFALAPTGQGNFYVAGVVDSDEDVQGTGVRLGYVKNTPKAGPAAFHVGYRTFDAGFGVSIDNLDLQFAAGLPGKSTLAKATCLVFGFDAVNISDADNGFLDTYIAGSFGRDFPVGSVSLVPFATLGVNGSSAGDSDAGEWAPLSEFGLGLRIGNRFTATLSARSIHDDAERSFIRFVAAFPFGAR